MRFFNAISSWRERLLEAPAFWGTGYKGGNNKWRHIKGISVQGRLGKPRLAVVFCPLDYLCSMETAEIDSRAPLSARRSYGCLPVHDEHVCLPDETEGR